MADMDWTDLAQDRDMWQTIANSQSVGCLSLGIYFLFLVFTEQVLFLRTHKHTTLTLLSSITQNIPSSL
jgi:hypothetical protein